MEVIRYVTESGSDVFGHWLANLRDPRAAAKIVVRIDRLAAGNLGNCKKLRGGVSELRIDWGPGYRVYFATPTKTSVLLLCGGDKRKQAADIKKAIKCWNDYQQRMGKS